MMKKIDLAYPNVAGPRVTSTRADLRDVAGVTKPASRHLALLVAAVLCAPVVSAGDTLSRTYDIPAQTLEAALKEFATAADLQLMFSPTVVAGRTARAVHGEYTVQQALMLLLNGTGLEFRFDGHDTVIVRPAGDVSNVSEATLQHTSHRSEAAPQSPGSTPANQGAAAASAAGAEADSPSTGVLQEIIVTAQKRAERLQDVPMAITAFSSQELERKGISNFQDYARMVPGLAFVDPGPGRSDFILRGITSAGNPITQFYIDDTPQSASNAGGTQIKGADPKIFDIERVEVLRGPQGTLYGASSMGGTIRVITNKPDASEFASKAEMTVSSTHGGGENLGINGMVNLPVVDDQLAVRIVGTYRKDAGWIDRIDPPTNAGVSPNLPRPHAGSFMVAEREYNASESRGARISARYEPNQDLTVTAALIWQDIEQDNPGLVDVDLADRQQRIATLQEPRFDKMTQSSLTIEYDLGFANLISSTSHLDRKVADRTDMTFVGRNVFGTDFVLPNDRSNPFTVLTQELRLASQADSPLNYTVGLFYLDLDGGEDQTVYAPGFTAATGVPTADDLMFDENTTSSERQYAVFGQASYNILEKLQLTAGFRWFSAETSFKSYKDGTFNGGPTYAEGEAKDKGWTPKLSLDYHLDDQKMLYASAAKGFRVGQPNLYVPPAACGADLQALGYSSVPKSIESDSLWQYELGTKTEWLDRRLVFNAAVYYIDWTGIPQSTPLNCGFSLTLNVGKASSQGVEVELQATPVDGLTLGFAGSYTDARLERDAPGLRGGKGDRLQNVPRVTLAGNAEYKFPIRAGYDGFVAVDYNYVSDSYIDFNFSNRYSRRPEYDLANFRFGVSSGDWDVALFVENIFDKRAVLSVEQGMSYMWTINRPRTVGITLRKNWQ